MPANDVTYLRFYAADEHAIPRVNPSDLAALTTELETLFTEVTGVAARMVFAVSPRRGCLEFAFVPVLVALAASPRDLVDTVGTTLDVLWRIVFGDRGVLDLIVRDVRRIDKGTVQAQETERDVTVALRLTSYALDNPSCVERVRQLATIANSIKGDVVNLTIEFRDEGEISLLRELAPPLSAKRPVAGARRLAQPIMVTIDDGGAGYAAPYSVNRRDGTRTEIFVVQARDELSKYVELYGGPPIIVEPKGARPDWWTDHAPVISAVITRRPFED